MEDIFQVKKSTYPTYRMGKHTLGGAMATYQPLHEQAYDHLIKLLTNQELEYGQIYSEAQMAQEIGISRTPFMQALVRLSNAQLIDIIPSKGFRLHQFPSASSATYE